MDTLQREKKIKNSHEKDGLERKLYDQIYCSRICVF